MTEQLTSGRWASSCMSSLPEREYPSSLQSHIRQEEWGGRGESSSPHGRVENGSLVFSSTCPWQLLQRWCALSLMESAQAALHSLRPDESLQHHPEGLRPNHRPQKCQPVKTLTVKSRWLEYFPGRRWPWWSGSAGRTRWRGSDTRRMASPTSRNTAGSRWPWCTFGTHPLSGLITIYFV